MRTLIKVFQQKSLDWDLNLSEAAVFDYLFEAPAWASAVIIDGLTWYWVSRTKAAQDLLLLSKTARNKIASGEPLKAEDADTFYRHYKSLSNKGLITLTKASGKDCFRLTEKAKTWNTIEPGKISDYPEKNPAYNSISISNTYSSNIPGKISDYPETTPQLENLPPAERKIALALEACKTFFKDWPAMKKSLLDMARLKPEQVDFEQELESWVRHNSQNSLFIQDPTVQISKSFSRWLINTKSFSFKKPAPVPEVHKTTARKSIRKREDTAPDILALALSKKV